MKYFFITAIFCLLQSVNCLGQQTERREKPLTYLNKASIQEGEKLFAAYCTQCHSVCDQELGPPLTDIMYKRPFPWLLSFIQNSSELIAAGDQYAVHLYDSYNRMKMPAFSELEEQDIIDILGYIKNQSDPNRKDTLIESTAELNKLIVQARKDPFRTEDKNYYQIQSEYKIPVDEASALNGKGLFNQFCSSCHEVCQSDVGPALAGISKRRPLSWLLAFIEDPVEVVKRGDHYANFLISNFDIIMPGFDYISTEQKLDILAYIRRESAGPVSSSGANSKLLAQKNEPDSANWVEKVDSPMGDKRSQVDTEAKLDRDIFKWIFIPLIMAIFGIIAFFIIKYFKK